MATVREEGRVLGKRGTRLAYDCGCRCNACREAHNRHSRGYKAQQKRFDQ